MRAQLPQPRGRPSLPVRHRRATILSTRVTREQYDVIYQQARQSGMTVAAWFRQLLTRQ